MKKAARESQIEGRIINLSSDLHRWGVDKEVIAFNEVNNEKSKNVGTIPSAKFTISKDNIEQVFAVNLLGQFLLTSLLLDTMKKTARESLIEGRIINLSSNLHRRGVNKEVIASDEINNEKRLLKGRSFPGKVLITRRTDSIDYPTLMSPGIRSHTNHNFGPSNNMDDSVEVPINSKSEASKLSLNPEEIKIKAQDLNAEPFEISKEYPSNLLLKIEDASTQWQSLVV
ncbi:hypothetical protein AgCh_000598 [Apium graveolens]